MSKASNTKSRKAKKAGAPGIQEALRLGTLLAEKCELKKAEEAYVAALGLAKKARDLRATMEAISGLLRLAGEALDKDRIARWEKELDAHMAAHPGHVPPMAWFCKGAIARHREENKVAQRYFHRYLKAVRKESPGQGPSQEELVARGWVMIAITAARRGHARLARWLLEEILRQYGEKHLRTINGIIHLQLGTMAEKQRDLAGALACYQKAHAAFLAEHNWYYHLHVLYGYARVARMQQNYAQAYWYLDLMDKAAGGPEFGLLRREIAAERARLEQDAVDLLIDSRRGLVRTRDGGPISLRKQYVLLNILEALSAAHHRAGADSERGLSKAEIIERVWKETYRPEAHDNKLYYNINRLRKLIEPDMRQPQYLLNWKEGYRLAPGLRVHLVGGVGQSNHGGGKS